MSRFSTFPVTVVWIIEHPGHPPLVCGTRKAALAVAPTLGPDWRVWRADIDGQTTLVAEA